MHILLYICSLEHLLVLKGDHNFGVTNWEAAQVGLISKGHVVLSVGN